jgi:hypothetical protein
MNDTRATGSDTHQITFAPMIWQACRAHIRVGDEFGSRSKDIKIAAAWCRP